MRRFSIIFLLLLLPRFVAIGQEMDTTIRISIQAGTGWMHYNNNLVIGHDDVRNDFLGSSLRIMWEPEHRLSIGLESGYYKLYEVSLQGGDGSHVALSIVPIMANIKMRILPEFFVTGGAGLVAMYSQVTKQSEVTKSTVFSYSNVQLSGLYLHKLSQQFGVGAELKFMWIDKTNDSLYSLQAVVSWRF